ncbi:MAG: S8 family serine peptidase, partial [Armatimonadota bacterium]
MRKARPYLLVMVSSAVVLALCSACLGQAYVPGEVLVKFQPGTPAAAVAKAHGGVGGQTIKTFGRIDVQHVRVGKGLSVSAAVQAYQRNPNVVYAEPNYLLYADVTPNDTYFGELWGLHNTGQAGGTPDADLDAPEAWDIATEARDPGTSDLLIVAVIDTGTDYTHPDLAANMWVNSADPPGGGDNDGNGYVDDVHGINAITGSGDPWDDHGHGTHTAGTVGAVGNNGTGVTGVSWRVRIMALKFLTASGYGDTADAVECIQYVTAMKLRGEPIVAMSNSWGGGGYSQALYDAIDAAGDQEILFVAAAGNSGRNTDRSPHYPSSYDLPEIISVAASDHNDKLAREPGWGSNYGRGSVDLAAPGVNILSTIPGGYAYASGTSMATPHVSGAAALVRAKLGGDALGTKDRLLATVDPLGGKDGKRLLSGGRLNLRRALEIPNQPPSVSITSPADGATFASGALIAFGGMASDSEDGDLTSSLAWTSSIDGPIGGGGSFSAALSDGVHTIAAAVTDSGGATGSDSISITVGTPPPSSALVVAVTTDK